MSKSPKDLEGTEDSFLTPRQLEVLKYRRQGKTHEDIAKIFGTTRSNISILERRAHQNIEKAKKTLDQWMMVQSPIMVRINAGTDVFQIPNRIFEEADKRNIALPLNAMDLIISLRSKAPTLLKRRVLKQDLDIYVTLKGDVMVDLSKNM